MAQGNRHTGERAVDNGSANNGNTVVMKAGGFYCLFAERQMHDDPAVNSVFNAYLRDRVQAKANVIVAKGVKDNLARALVQAQLNELCATATVAMNAGHTQTRTLRDLQCATDYVHTVLEAAARRANQALPPRESVKYVAVARKYIDRLLANEEHRRAIDDEVHNELTAGYTPARGKSGGDFGAVELSI